MNGYVSENLEDLEKELKHAKLLHVALCPYEARTVIALVAIKALDAMIEKNADAGCPGSMFPPDTDWENITDEVADAAHGKWTKALEDMKHAFEMSVLDDDAWMGDPVQMKAYEEGMLAFATYFLHLWV